MTKKEIIWRYILSETLSRSKDTFTQKDVAQIFGFSTSTIFNSLKIPRKLGAVEVTGRFFRIRDAEKLLVLWATFRNLRNEIIYETHVKSPVREIESFMPADVIFGAFSAYRLAHDDCPSDYSSVYVYSDNFAEIQRRFPKTKGIVNLFVLKPDRVLHTFGKTTPDVQTFVDLWNIPDWYAKDFLSALKRKLNFNA